MNSIKLASFGNKKQAYQLAAKLTGKSYMKLKATVCPHKGQFHVELSSAGEWSEAELKEMALGILAHEASMEVAA